MTVALRIVRMMLVMVILLIPSSESVDECTGSGKVCGTAGQVCVDPTPEGSATQGDWWCQCVGQSKIAAIGRVANCGGGSVGSPVSIGDVDSVVPVTVLSSRLSTLTLAGWQLELESKITALQGRITTASNPLSSSTDTTVWIAFFPPNAAANRALFLSEALCCPLSCSSTDSGSGTVAYNFCVSMGITSPVPLHRLPCESLDKNYCSYGTDCSLIDGGNICISGTSSTPVHTAILVPIFVTLGSILLTTIFIQYLQPMFASQPPKTEEQSPQPVEPGSVQVAFNSPPYGVPASYVADQSSIRNNAQITR
eukprot:TRINITY_DN17006_c0_g1_i1.p1 TRINITY_DN17006_c0_g1~~TRINITY_DN17006_c0_g1_i1.p1  ORF type:complete len:310 (+),score=44.04 TRINITY_DN17006_c0_g1_i1:53-982(+)